MASERSKCRDFLALSFIEQSLHLVSKEFMQADFGNGFMLSYGFAHQGTLMCLNNP